MAYSRIDLREAVLTEMGVKDPQESTAAHDAVLVDERCQQKLEMLADDGLVQFDIDGDIPGRYFIPLVQVIAPELVNAYGISDQRVNAIMANAQRAMRDLYRMKTPPYYGSKPVYY
jgi:hypothetical protein